MPEFVLADFPSGGVVYGKNGYIVSDSSNFFWDATNHRLGLLTGSPSSTLDIGASHQLQVSSTGVITSNTAAAGFMIVYDAAGTNYYTLTSSAIGGNYALTIPAITGADTLAVLGLAQSFTATQQFHQINPTADNSYSFGTAALRWSAEHALLFDVEHAASDANPTAQLGDAYLKMGPGGGSALDSIFERVSTPAFQTTVALQIGGVAGTAATANQIWTSTQGASSTTLYIGNAAINVTNSNVASVSNSDGTLTINPTTGAVVASLALGHANTWSSAQTFPSSDVIIQNPGATHTYTIAGAAIGASYVLTLPLMTGADTLAALGVAQTWAATQTFPSSDVLIQNPAATKAYTIVAAAIANNYNLTLPLITASDTFAVLGLAQTFTADQTFHNILAAADATYAIGTATNRFTAVHSQAFDVEHSSADANPTSQIGDAFLKFGAGGGNALDSEMQRVSTPAIQFDVPIQVGGVAGTAATNNQIWTSTQGAGSTTLYIGNAAIVTGSAITDVASQSDFQLVDTNLHHVINYTTSGAGNYVVHVYYRVAVATTVLTLTVNWTDNAGAQTYTFLTTESEPVQSYSCLPLLINCTNGSGLTVDATAGTANQVYVSSVVYKG